MHPFAFKAEIHHNQAHARAVRLRQLTLFMMTSIRYTCARTQLQPRVSLLPIKPLPTFDRSRQPQHGRTL